jgi:hypothetical protein
VGERTGLSIWKAMVTISFLLCRRLLWRLKEKYVVRDFHPLVVFYCMAFFLLLAAIPLGIRVFYFWIAYDIIPKMNTLAFFFSVIVGLQSLFFAMWFDIEYNRDLE